MKGKCMKINLEKEKNNIVKLDIEIPAQDAVNEYNKAVRMISEHVNIAGFRKGKAPRNLVEKHVGVARIKEDALEGLVPKALQEAITEHKLDVISHPSIESYEFEVGQDVKIVARVELRPEVKLGEYKNLTIEVEESVTPDDAFDKALDGLLQRHATFELVVDRASKNTDVVVMDFDGSVNGEKIQGGAAENYSLDLANSNFIPGFAEQLIGKKVGEEFDVKVDFPKDYHEKKLAGQPAIFKIKLKEIKAKALPEVTDEFAQKVGPFKTVADLKADIQSFIDSTKEKEDRKIADNAIFENILNSTKIEIQDSMIERESEALLEEYKQRLTMQGFNFEDAMKDQNQTELMADLKKEAAVRIKSSLVIDKIAQNENIKVDYSEMETKLKEVEAMYRMSRADMLKQIKQNPGVFDALSQQVLNEKVVKFLAENNKVEFKKQKVKGKN
jgi:trigger factor